MRNLISLIFTILIAISVIFIGSNFNKNNKEFNTDTILLCKDTQTSTIKYKNNNTEKLNTNEKQIFSDCIRLHVIANSDSDLDQQLKLRVRDRIITEFSSRFAKSESLEQSRRIVKNSLSEIEEIAYREIKGSSFNYGVNAVYGRFDFPDKVYGEHIYPSGNYEALKVVLGDGSGKNWWCVMFPPLCFVDITHGVATDKRNINNEKIKHQDKDEDECRYEEASEDIYEEKASKEIKEIKYKFKIVELIKKVFN